VFHQNWLDSLNATCDMLERLRSILGEQYLQEDLLKKFPFSLDFFSIFLSIQDLLDISHNLIFVLHTFLGESCSYGFNIARQLLLTV
jgi:hypothetical protein